MVITWYLTFLFIIMLAVTMMGSELHDMSAEIVALLDESNAALREERRRGVSDRRRRRTGALSTKKKGS